MNTTGTDSVTTHPMDKMPSSATRLQNNSTRTSLIDNSLEPFRLRKIAFIPSDGGVVSTSNMNQIQKSKPKEMSKTKLKRFLNSQQPRESGEIKVNDNK